MPEARPQTLAGQGQLLPACLRLVGDKHRAHHLSHQVLAVLTEHQRTAIVSGQVADPDGPFLVRQGPDPLLPPVHRWRLSKESDMAFFQHGHVAVIRAAHGCIDTGLAQALAARKVPERFRISALPCLYFTFDIDCPELASAGIWQECHESVVIIPGGDRTQAVFPCCQQMESHLVGIRAAAAHRLPSGIRTAYHRREDEVFCIADAAVTAVGKGCRPECLLYPCEQKNRGREFLCGHARPSISLLHVSRGSGYAWALPWILVVCRHRLQQGFAVESRIAAHKAVGLQIVVGAHPVPLAAGTAGTHQVSYAKMVENQPQQRIGPARQGSTGQDRGGYR